MIAALVILLYLAALALWLAERGLLGGFRAQWRRLPRGAVALLAVLTVWAVAVGGGKEPAAPRVSIASFVTALRSGVMLDPSGRIGEAAIVAATAQVASEASDIVAAASNAVVAAQGDFDLAAWALTNRTIEVAYIAADLPRAEPYTWTNHNIAATIQRVTQDGTSNILAYVWYSEAPAIEPQVALYASTVEGVWTRMVSITNSFPATFDVDGIPCVEYRLDIPTAARGTVFRPEYELAFGGLAAADYLIVPSGGVLVSTNAVELSPYTGWDTAHPEPHGTNLAVRYAGGIAVEVVWYGTNYTGVSTP